MSLPRPGGDAWLTIDLAERRSRRTNSPTAAGSRISNDLHKGRNTGAAWSLFIDVFAFAALVFAITGLLLLKMHAHPSPAHLADGGARPGAAAAAGASVHSLRSDR